MADGPDKPAAPVREPASRVRGPGELALGLVLLAVLVGLALVGHDHWRKGLLIVGIGLCGGAGLRLVLPTRSVGLLAVRTRAFDVAVMAGLGVAVLVLVSSVPVPTH
jgi:hypothetical protein